jgi:subtilisin-like proprotein convertase family protein
MYLSIDAGNEPPPNSNTNIAYSYEGNLTGTDGSSRGNFRGGTRFTNVFLLTTDSPPPSNRHDAGSFGTGYRFRSPNLPFGAAPTSVSDSIFMPEGLTINDVNVFVGINHSYTNDISVTLRNPSGSTSRILYAGNAPDNGDHMITIFDDQADSTANANMRGPWSPRVRPVNNLAIFNGQNAGGYWRITVTDIFPGADDGRLIGWGIQFNNQAVTAVNEEITGIPKKFALHQNYPNPFNPTTTIKYDLAKESFVKITVYDILGKQVQTLVNEQKKAGSYALEINASGLASGVYFYKIEAGTFVATKKMMLIK